jgi:hypothetical protein
MVNRPNNVPAREVEFWEAAEATLRVSEPGDNTDEYIDTLAIQVFNNPNSFLSSRTLLVALNLAKNSLTLRSVARALAVSATPDDHAAVDSLILFYRQNIDEPFLGPALLEALSLFALRSPLARLETAAALLRIEPHGPRYLVVKAAKIIGKLNSADIDRVLFNKLQELLACSDLGVQSEVHYQLGVITLTTALLAPDQVVLRRDLEIARTHFTQAEATEELRADAVLFRVLTEAVLQLYAVTTIPFSKEQPKKARLEQIQKDVIRASSNATRIYASPLDDLIAVRTLEIADALQRATMAASEAEDWTNFDTALLNLATVHSLILSRDIIYDVIPRLSDALSMIASNVLAPQLGTVLLRAVGRRRITLVVKRYEADPTHIPAIAISLKALEQVTEVLDREDISTPLAREYPQLNELARRLNMTAEEVLRNFLQAVDHGGVDRWIEGIGASVPQLPIDRTDKYGGDPAIDDTVRTLLGSLREHLQPYPREKWLRLVSVVEAVVSFAHYVRDKIPFYALCAEDQGMGQTAGESDLQEDLFIALRMRFGRSVAYELTRIGGGRPDTGIRFEECFFPIEVKAEYGNISADHIRSNYLAQVNIYAASTDHVAFLMILDLRAVNAAGHVAQAKPRRRRNLPPENISLYSLGEGFWLDTLPLDAQLPQMKSKVVIVGLVPGNRPRPSSTTTYSSRPKQSSRKQGNDIGQ